MNLDLNARRAARAAKISDPKVVVVDGREYRLVDELPVTLMEFVTKLDMVGAVKALLADPEQDWADFSLGLTIEDVNEMVELYGSALGESPASTDSSTTIGGPSGPTSNASTASISLPVPTAPKR